jgi:hypothetical protein
MPDIRSVRTKLFSGLLSSWLTSPIAILIAQLFGFANEPHVLIALLCLSAMVPMQLLCNEAMAPAYAKANTVPAFSAWACILLIQAISSLVFLIGLKQLSLDLPSVTALTACIAASTFLSTLTSFRLIQGLLSGIISHKIIIQVSILPNLAILLIFTVSALLGIIHPMLYALVYLIVLLPAILQYRFIRRSLPTNAMPASVSHWPSAIFFLACITICIATYVSNSLRVSFINFIPNYAGLLLVVINVLASACMTFTKTSFLMIKSAPSKFGSISLLAVAICIVSISLALQIVGTEAGLAQNTASFIALQFAIVLLIVASRNLLVMR